MCARTRARARISLGFWGGPGHFRKPSIAVSCHNALGGMGETCGRTHVHARAYAHPCLHQTRWHSHIGLFLHRSATHRVSVQTVFLSIPPCAAGMPLGVGCGQGKEWVVRGKRMALEGGGGHTQREEEERGGAHPTLFCLVFITTQKHLPCHLTEPTGAGAQFMCACMCVCVCVCVCRG